MTDASWAGTGSTCRNSPHFVGPVLVAFSQSPERDSRFAHHDGFRGLAAGAPHQAISVGSHAAGEGDRTAPPPRTGPRLRLLGLSAPSPWSPSITLRRPSAHASSSQDSGFGSFYFGFVAVWAVAVAVSIAGLFIRRFIVRPVWLGKVAPESGFIAFLIFTLMVTYLAGLLDRRGIAAGQGVWWLHTAGAADFPAADSAYQASAPGAEPGHRLPQAAGLQPDSAALRRRGFRSGHRQGRDADRCAAGLLAA